VTEVIGTDFETIGASAPRQPICLPTSKRLPGLNARTPGHTR
jgi:hypothetical protein